MSDSIKPGRESIDKLENILRSLTDRKVITQQRMMKLYGYMENSFDGDLQKVEDIILKEIENKNKQEDFLKIVEIMEGELFHGNT